MRLPFVTFMFFGAMIGGCRKLPPSDNTMIRQFRCNREAFQNLANMMAIDLTLHWVTFDPATIIRTSVSETRLAEYRGVLTQIGCETIERQHLDDDEYIEIRAYSGGAFPDDGIYKGFAYFPRGLPNRWKNRVVAGLDEHPAEWRGRVYYRAVTENWYLYALY